MMSGNSKPAFTLVEMMVTLVIFGIVGAGLCVFTVESSKSIFWSTEKSKITSKFREFTSKIANDALNGSHAFMYRSYNVEDLNQLSDRLGWNDSGDCLVFVSTQPPSDDINGQRYYDRIVVYYSEPEDAPRPVFRRVITIDAATISADTSIEKFFSQLHNNDYQDLLNNQQILMGQPEVVIELARGLSNNSIFRKVTDDAFMVNAEIVYGNETKRVFNSYNFTVSTRG